MTYNPDDKYWKPSAAQVVVPIRTRISHENYWQHHSTWPPKPQIDMVTQADGTKVAAEPSRFAQNVEQNRLREDAAKNATPTAGMP